MRLADLRDDLAYWEGELPCPTFEVARRVTALFDDCPDCRGTGERGKHPAEVGCPRCGGMGMLYSEEGEKATTEAGPGTVISVPRLFRFLFADSGAPKGEG